jgi:hypothetical protein
VIGKTIHAQISILMDQLMVAGENAAMKQTAITIYEEML